MVHTVAEGEGTGAVQVTATDCAPLEGEPVLLTTPREKEDAAVDDEEELEVLAVAAIHAGSSLPATTPTAASAGTDHEESRTAEPAGKVVEAGMVLGGSEGEAAAVAVDGGEDGDEATSEKGTTTSDSSSEEDADDEDEDKGGTVPSRDALIAMESEEIEVRAAR